MRTTGLLFIFMLLMLFNTNPITQAAPAVPLKPTATTPDLIAQAQARGDIDALTADLYLAYALFSPAELPAAYRSTTPWSGTLPLRDLAQRNRYRAESTTAVAITQLVASACSSSNSTLPSTTTSAYFWIEHGATTGLTISDYATSLDAAWTKEVIQFGWAAPPVLPSNPPPGNRYHVRIDNLGGGLYGYVSSGGDHAGYVGNNPNTLWPDQSAYATCMVLNSDYTPFPGSAQQALDATTAHEFNHSIQFGLGALSAGSFTPDDAFVEGGATWMEDEAFDNADDNYNYLWPEFDQCMGQYTASPYPYWITFRGLTERFGTNTPGAGEQIMQDFWEITSRRQAHNLDALNLALTNRGTNLANAFHDYAIAVKFSKSCGGGYSLPHCFEEGANYVASSGLPAVHKAIASVGGSASGTVQDHYAINWVSLPTTTSYTATLQNTSGGGALRASLVCDTGSSLQVTPFSQVAGSGQTAVAARGTTPCTSIVAVITNQAQSSANPSSCTAHSYTLATTNTPPPVLTEFLYLPIIIRPVPAAPPKPLYNGDFEGGVVDWTEFSSNNFALILSTGDLPITPHSGSWAVWLGGYPSEVSSISQQVTISASAPTLQFWQQIASGETTCDASEQFQVLVDNTAVSTLPLCTTNTDSDWIQRSVNLSAYNGQTVTLAFRAITNGDGENSNVFLDDVGFGN